MADDSENRNKNSSMSQEFDFSDFYQNEDSVDITNYMTSANLELCDDELFQSLFPSSPDNQAMVKSEKTDAFESEFDAWNEPNSACSSACSSRVQSPVQFGNPHSMYPGTERPIGAHSETSLYPDSFFNPTTTHVTPLLLPPSNEEKTPVKLKEKLNPKIQVMIKSEPNGVGNNPGASTEVDNNNNVGNVTILRNLVKLTPKSYILSQFIESGGEDPAEGVKRMGDQGLDGEVMKKKRFKTDECVKSTEEYKIKRERNNIAVRKSREKAKLKSMETQSKVELLTDENRKLKEKVSKLTNELDTLKGILKAIPRQRLPSTINKGETMNSGFYESTES